MPPCRLRPPCRPAACARRAAHAAYARRAAHAACARRTAHAACARPCRPRRLRPPCRPCRAAPAVPPMPPAPAVPPMPPAAHAALPPMPAVPPTPASPPMPPRPPSEPPTPASPMGIPSVLLHPCPACRSDSYRRLGRRGGASHISCLGEETEIVRCRKCHLVYPRPFLIPRGILTTRIHPRPTSPSTIPTKKFSQAVPLRWKQQNALDAIDACSSWVAVGASSFSVPGRKDGMSRA